MKRISSLLIGTGFVLMTSLATANTMTSMDSNWTCTTNASSASTDTDTDKKADEQMADTHKSAADAYAFASQHCRDCTKITCEKDD